MRRKIIRFRRKFDTCTARRSVLMCSRFLIRRPDSPINSASSCSKAVLPSPGIGAIVCRGPQNSLSFLGYVPRPRLSFNMSKIPLCEVRPILRLTSPDHLPTELCLETPHLTIVGVTRKFGSDVLVGESVRMKQLKTPPTLIVVFIYRSEC
jgi:hypothetical protein